MTENQKENLFVVTALQGGLLDGGPFFGPKIRLIWQPKGGASLKQIGIGVWRVAV